MNRKPVILITGGAGYIGSHVLLALRDRGLTCVVVDDLSTGRRGAVPADVPLLVADIADLEKVRAFCREHGVTAIMHFAGSIRVEESVSEPMAYYANNTCSSRTVIQLAMEEGIRHFIFSSTAAVYGDAETVPVAETAPTRPSNPYGRSKLMTEWMLADAAAAGDISYVALRYFNVAGADPGGRSGQVIDQATHLIKVACETATGQRAGMTVFGNDYDTPDGTCVRDFIHVTDLAEAHVLAFEYLRDGGASTTLNCGYGHGYSVRQVIDAVGRAAAKDLPVVAGDRRPGDVARLTSAPDAIRKTLGWSPRHDDLDEIVQTALDWERRQLEKAKGTPS